ncbi:AMP-binding protein, partial [bacterium AH-315-N14]|nr:AMP-binding protein [bacterium AH-315-N14]
MEEYMLSSLPLMYSDKLIQRHESLRTSFEVLEEGMVQRIYKEVDFEIDKYEVKEEKEIAGIIKSFIRSFDLGKAPLLRVGLIKVHPQKHILMYDMHHIISDGTSMGVLVREFSKLYGGDELPELRIQYKDYAVWQNELFRSEKIKAQEEYWLKQFEGEIPVLNLPTDYQRPSVQSFEGDRVNFELHSEITEKLRKIARETGSTMYMVLLSAFNILLSKYSGQEDIVVGSPIAGRPHADLENIMGMFVNTLAMRNSPSGEKTYREFLREVKENALGAYENQDYQFEELVDNLKVARDFSRNPVFDVMFVLQNTEMEELSLEGIAIRQYKSDNQISKFDMTLTAVEGKVSIGLSIEYCTKLFNKDTVERMYRHLENIILTATDNPDMKLGEIEILTEEEKQQILIEFNDTDAEYPREKTIQQLFEEQVERTPDNIAVVYEDKTLTYRELNERANQLARVLRYKGVVQDSIVGIMVERSLEMIVGIMGILKAGGAYLPIDPEYPIDRIEYMLEDSGTSILLTQKHLRDKTTFNGEKIELDDEEVYIGDVSNLDIVNRSNDLAYIIYTSGSTGKPKGVMVEHHSICNTLNWRKSEYSLGGNNKVLQLFSFAFDGFVTSSFTPMISGSTIVMVNEEEAKDPIVLNNYINKFSITEFISVPTIYLSILECASEESLNSLKTVILAGERLSENVVKMSKSLNGQIEIVNEYGPTENSVVATIKRGITTNQIISIGKPISNIKIYIVDQYNSLCPIGVAGELCITGYG